MNPEFKHFAKYLWIMLVNAMTAIVIYLAWFAFENRSLIEWNTERINGIIESRVRDRWTGADDRAWREQLRKANPGLVVPEPE